MAFSHCSRGFTISTRNMRSVKTENIFVCYQTLGYAPDFVQVATAPYIKDIKRKGEIREICKINKH